jgi:fructuronate reductase
MREEAAPTIPAAPGQNLDRYAQDLIARFANPALNHRLIQIAMDGSQKLPQRWLETLALHQRQGGQCPAILAGISAWISHLRGANGPVDDPRAEDLGKAAVGPEPLAALFGSGGLLASEWLPDEAARAALAASAP